MREIKLENSELVALIDDDDFMAVIKHRWYYNKSTATHSYVVAYINGAKTYLHKFLIPSAVVVDHKNNNGLDNQRHNIRPATFSLNMAAKRVTKKPNATSKFRGVALDKRRGHFRAQISRNSTYIYIGRFDNEIDAAKAYDIKAKELFGEFASLNFPPSVESQAITLAMEKGQSE